MSGNDEFDNMLAGASDEADSDEEELDLSEEGPERNFEPFRGEFEAQVISTEVTNAVSSGARMVKVEAIVTEEGEHQNQHLWFNCMLGGKGVWFTKAFIRSLGLEYDEDKPKVKPSEWVDLPFVAVTKIKPKRKVAGVEYAAKTEVANFKVIAPESTEGAK